MLNSNDRAKLTDSAIDRFYDIYPVPDRAIVSFTLDAQLLIVVDRPSQVDDLTTDIEWLKSTAYHVFGAIEVSIWFEGIEVNREMTISEVNSEKAPLPQIAMPTATAERPATKAQAIAIVPAIKELEAPTTFMSLDDLTAEMGIVTGRSADECRQSILNRSPKLYVATSIAEQMIRQQIGQLQAMLDRLSANGVTVEAVTTNGNQAPATKPAAKRKSHAKKPADTAA